MLTRRATLRLLLGALTLPLLWLWRDLSRVHRRLAPEAKRLLRLERPREGVRLHEEAIVIAEGGAIRALSTRCPHLGCKIDQVRGGALYCPCHGSRFDLEGRRLSGPAQADLSPLEARVEGEQLLIEL